MTPNDIFKNVFNSLISNIHTSLPGIIRSYDASTNKAVIQPALNKKFLSGEMPMPLLESVPIIFPNHIRFPIVEGEYVLLVFIERSIDLWLSVGGQVTPQDPRKFDLSDAVAIPGLMPFTSPGTGNNSSFSIEFGGSSIAIQEDGSIQIKTVSTVAIGTQAVELLQKISDALGAIASMTVTVPPGELPPFPFPVDNAATFLSLQAEIDSLKGSIT